MRIDLAFINMTKKSRDRRVLLRELNRRWVEIDKLGESLIDRTPDLDLYMKLYPHIQGELIQRTKEELEQSRCSAYKYLLP